MIKGRKSASKKAVKAGKKSRTSKRKPSSTLGAMEKKFTSAAKSAQNTVSQTYNELWKTLETFKKILNKMANEHIANNLSAAMKERKAKEDAASKESKKTGRKSVKSKTAVKSKASSKGRKALGAAAKTKAKVKASTKARKVKATTAKAKAKVKASTKARKVKATTAKAKAKVKATAKRSNTKAKKSLVKTSSSKKHSPKR